MTCPKRDCGAKMCYLCKQPVQVQNLKWFEHLDSLDTKLAGYSAFCILGFLEYIARWILGTLDSLDTKLAGYSGHILYLDSLDT